jgi:hypothetical protein
MRIRPRRTRTKIDSREPSPRNPHRSNPTPCQLPDVDGNRIPSAIDEGSAEIAGLRGEAEEILVGVNAGIYNVQKATCGNPCNVCNGETNVFMQIEYLWGYLAHNTLE